MWHFVENGSRKGPVSLEEIQSLIAQEIITPTTLVWKRGMDDWLVASETELKGLLPEDTPPPIPVDSPPPVPESLAPNNVPNIPNATPRTPIFFPVSGFKFFVMSLVTWGFYDFFWFYKNWKLIKIRDRSSIMPFWRACFAPIFCYPLLARIKNTAKLQGVDTGFYPWICAFLWFSWWFLAPFRLDNPQLWTIASHFAVLWLLSPQVTVNQLNQKLLPNHDPNDQFTGWNIAAIVVGGILLVLEIAGILLPT
jgi:hypothetical protein